MSTHEYIFVATDLDPKQVAERLSELLGLTVIPTADGGVALGRRIAEGRVEQVGGEVYRNIYASYSDLPEEQTILDGYSIVWGIRYTGGDEDVQASEARKLFGEVTEKARWPALLLHGLERLVAAWRPELGLREYVPAVSVDDEDRQIWEPYQQKNP
jgi:hypothetical protein